MKFTDKFIRSLKPEVKRYEKGEGTGLYIRVTPSGTKTWVFKYRFNGRFRRISFGNYPEMSLANARGELARFKDQKSNGLDPQHEKLKFSQEQNIAPTVNDFSHEYLERWAKPNKKSWKEDERALNKEILPYIGKLKLKEIHRRDIIFILDRIKDRGSLVMSNRVKALLSRIFNFAIERGVLDASPVAHIPSTKEVSRDRVLSIQEISSLWQAMNQSNIYIGLLLAIELILRTGQRPGEVLRIEIADIDESESLWTIPAQKSKNGMANTIPLSNKSFQIIQYAKSLTGSNWIFESPRFPQKHISRHSLTNSMRKLSDKAEIIRATPHDLRRTAATHISKLGFNRLIVDKILNHKDFSVGGIYDRYSYDQEKRSALESWGERLDNAIKINNFLWNRTS